MLNSETGGDAAGIGVGAKDPAATAGVSVAEGIYHILGFNLPPDRYHEGDAGAELNRHLHELGHTLGLFHAGDDKPGDGIVRRVGFPRTFDECIITPFAPNADAITENNCGERSLNRDAFATKRYDHYYWDPCAGERIRNYWR